MVGLYETARRRAMRVELDGSDSSAEGHRLDRDDPAGPGPGARAVPAPRRGLPTARPRRRRQLLLAAAAVSPEKPGRRYIGICAPGKSRPAVLIRVYVALLAAAQDLYEQHGAAADPWMTLVGYFNSLRELGGMRRLVEDDVDTRASASTVSETARDPGSPDASCGTSRS